MARASSVVDLLLGIVAVSALSSTAWASRPHPRPDEVSEVPFVGRPTYLENLEIGSPIADHGSHFGVKAAVEREGSGPDDTIPARAFLDVAHYLALTEGAGQTDQSYLALSFQDRSDLPQTPDSRSIAFRPWGWIEEIRQGPLSARGLVATASLDSFVELAEVTNRGDRPATIEPELRSKEDGDDVYEGITGVVFPAISWDRRSGPAIGEVELRRAFRGNWAVLGPPIPAITRRYRIDPSPVTLVDPGPLRLVAKLPPLVLAPGETRTVRIHFAESDRDEDLAALLDAGSGATHGSIDELASKLDGEWNAFFDSLPPLHSEGARDAELYRLAATGLRMNVYAPRGRMTEPCSVPSKVHFNFFWAWDTPFHAVAHREWDLALARADLTTLLAGQQPDGRIPQQLLDDLEPYETAGAPGNGQPPVQMWAARQLARSGSSPEWLDRVIPAFERSFAWWREQRDRNGNGLFEYANGNETGWDDTPRYDCPSLSNLCIYPAQPIEAIDLNAWLFDYADGLAELHASRGDRPAADAWRATASSLRSSIEDRMWDEQSGLYLDQRAGDGGGLEPVRVATPAGWWPLFLGITLDPGRARRVIEDHLLDPSEFFGDPDDPRHPRAPIPTVAYDDPHFDHAEDGFYWQGQVWLMPAYAALVTLSRYGYETESETLKQRLLEMIWRADPGGIHETYTANGGEIGLAEPWHGESSVFQFGWSTAFVMEMLLDRHQYDRFLFPGTTRATGHIGQLRTLPDGRDWLTIEAPQGRQPRLVVESLDGTPLVSARRLRVTLSNPWNDLARGTVALRFAAARVLSATDGAGAGVAVTRVGAESRIEIETATLPRTLDLEARSEGSFHATGGCGIVSGADVPGTGALAALSWMAAIGWGRHPHGRRARRPNSTIVKGRTK